jgi:arylsulfatase A-like enzyme
MKDEIVTFAEMLRLKGYATGYARKWHLDGDGKPQWRPTRKFGFEDNRYMFNRGHWKKMGDTRQGPRVAARNAKGEPNYDVNDADETSFTTDWLTTKAISFIKAHRDQSFCYMLSIPDPHGPNTVRKPYDSMFGADQAIIPRTLDKTDEQEPEWAKKDKGVDEDSLRKVLPKYYGMVRCIDDNVGRILNYLRRNELIDKTVVVFTSDHGDLCGEHGKYNKGNPYEGSAKIPFIVYYPEEIRGGTVVDRALSCIDFLPTILNLMGVEPSVPVDGRDASPFLRGGEVANWKDMAIMRGSANWLCAVTGEYKLVYSVYGPAWFFDLKKDPDELINCFSHPEYKELVSKLTHELIDYCEKYEDPTGQVPAVKRRMLAAL